MDGKELTRVRELYVENKLALSDRATPVKAIEDIAVIATIVDLVREELTKTKPIELQDTISLFASPETMHIHNALYSLGCYELKEITGWRKTIDATTKRVSYQVMVNGRLANLPSSFTAEDMKYLGLGLELRGLEFKELR